MEKGFANSGKCFAHDSQKYITLFTTHDLFIVVFLLSFFFFIVKQVSHSVSCNCTITVIISSNSSSSSCRSSITVMELAFVLMCDVSLWQLLSQYLHGAKDGVLRNTTAQLSPQKKHRWPLQKHIQTRIPDVKL